VTINLEQAKRLWELGVRKLPEDMYSRQAGSDKFTLGLDGSFCVIVEQYPAYSVEELIAMMQGDYEIRMNTNKTVDITVWYERYKGYDYFKGNTLTEVLCNKLIYDIENGIITVEEINK